MAGARRCGGRTYAVVIKGVVENHSGAAGPYKKGSGGAAGMCMWEVEPEGNGKGVGQK